MKMFLFLAPLALLSGCIKPATSEETLELATSTLSVQENWGRLSEKQPVQFSTTAEVSSLGTTGLGLVIVRRDVDQETFAAITLETSLEVGTKVCMTEVDFNRVAPHRDSFTLAKPC